MAKMHENAEKLSLSLSLSLALSLALSLSLSLRCPENTFPEVFWIKFFAFNISWTKLS